MSRDSSSIIADSSLALEQQISNLSDLNIRGICRQALLAKTDVRNITRKVANGEIPVNDFLRDLNLPVEGETTAGVIDSWIRCYDVLHDTSNNNTIDINAEAINFTFNKLRDYFVAALPDDEYRVVDEIFGVDSNLRAYLISHLGSKADCAKIVVELLGLAYSVSLMDNKENALHALNNIPHFGDDLHCPRGTFNRIEDLNIENSCGEYLAAFYRACKKVTVNKYAGDISKYAHEMYHIHIPSYLYFIIDIADRSDRDVMAAPEIANIDIADFSYNFSKDVRKELIQYVRNTSKEGFVRSFSEFVNENTNFSNRKETFTLDLKHLLGDVNARELDRCLQAESSINDYVMAVDFILASGLGLIDRTRSNFFFISEVIAKYIKENSGEEYDPLSLSRDIVEEKLDLFCVLVSSKCNSECGLDYQRKVDFFKAGFLERYQEFLIIHSAVGTKPREMSAMNVAIAIVYGVSENKAQELLTAGTVFKDYSVILGHDTRASEAVELEEERGENYRNVTNFSYNIVQRKDFIEIMEQMIQSFKNSDIQTYQETFEKLLRSVMVSAADRIETMPRSNSDYVSNIFPSKYSDADSIERILSMELVNSIRDKSINKLRLFYQNYFRVFEDDAQREEYVGGIIAYDYAQGLDVMRDIEGSDNIVNLVGEKTSFYKLVETEKVNLVLFLIKEKLKQKESLKSIFTNQAGLFGHLLGQREEYADIISEIYKAGFSVQEINDISSDGLIVSAAEEANYKLIDAMIETIIKKEILKAVPRNQSQASAMIMQALQLLLAGSDCSDYENRLVNLQNHYEKHAQEISNIDFWKINDRANGDSLMLRAAYGGDEKNIDIILKGLRLILLDKSYKQKITNLLENDIVANKSYALVMSFLIDHNLSSQFYELMTLIPEKTRYVMLFNPTEGEPSLIDRIIDSTEDRDVFLEKMFVRQERKNSEIKKEALLDHRQKFSNGIGMLHMIVDKGYKDLSLEYLDKFKSMGLDLSNFNFEDDDGVTPFESYINLLCASNGVDGVLFDQGIKRYGEVNKEFLDRAFKMIDNFVHLNAGLSENSAKNVDIFKQITTILDVLINYNYQPREFLDIYDDLTNKLPYNKRLELAVGIIDYNDIDDSYKEQIKGKENHYIFSTIKRYYQDMNKEEQDVFFQELRSFFQYFPEKITNSVLNDILLLDINGGSRGSDFLKYVIEQDPSIINRKDDGWGLIHHVVESGSSSSLDLLMSEKFDVTLRIGDSNDTAIYVAVENEDKETINYLRMHYYNINFKKALDDFSQKLENGFQTAFDGLKDTLSRDIKFVGSCNFTQMCKDLKEAVRFYNDVPDNLNSIFKEWVKSQREIAKKRRLLSPEEELATIIDREEVKVEEEEYNTSTTEGVKIKKIKKTDDGIGPSSRTQIAGSSFVGNKKQGVEKL